MTTVALLTVEHAVGQSAPQLVSPSGTQAGGDVAAPKIQFTAPVHDSGKVMNHPFEIVPPVAVLNITVGSESNAFKVVHLYKNQDGPITLSDPQSNSHSFAGELKSIKPDSEYQLIVKAVPPLAAGTMHGTIQLKTSLTNAPVIKVPVFAIVLPVHPADQASIKTTAQLSPDSETHQSKPVSNEK